jgi:hypothetical protein
MSNRVEIEDDDVTVVSRPTVCTAPDSSHYRGYKQLHVATSDGVYFFIIHKQTPAAKLVFEENRNETTNVEDCVRRTLLRQQTIDN